MSDYEKLGAFYLGRLFDLDQGVAQPDPLLYDAKDLTTHAVCVGMTGSGKTGLCLSLLEEAAIDGIPAIAIDPKGDLGNLLLTFPQLQPADFRPWLEPSEATRQGMTLEQLAQRTSDRWRQGLADWDQPPARIERFRSSVDVAIYTPGSNAGLPLSILRSFSAPSAQVVADADAFRERILSAVSGLLVLLGVNADPLRSREHIVLSKLLEYAWRAGRDLELGQLIREIQSPPFDKIGVMDLESIFPAKERFDLAMQLNNVMASPGFGTWMQGEPLDVQRLLYTAEGRPRLSIVSIAHLSDVERMFFVTTLLNEVVSWMRGQPGTSSLRALLYMDEVFGYLPPTANPPSKLPLLTLLKQARAFGLGCVLATQNPVDLDYKALSNAGTWLLGRLQTERDKARVLDGLEGASAASGTNFDRSETERILSRMGSRVFLMNNVHDDEPVVFQTRWALSYLRGPLTLAQIETLMSPRKAAAASTAAAPIPAAPGVEKSPDPGEERPVLQPGVEERFIEAGRPVPDGGRLLYRPALFGLARLHYVRATADLDQWRTVAKVCVISGEVPDNPWTVAEDVPADEVALQAEPATEARFAKLPSDLGQTRKYSTWKTALKNHLYRDAPLVLYECKPLKQRSEPGESEGDFRVRLKQIAFEHRDLAIEKLRNKYAPKLKTLTGRIRSAEQRVQRERAQLNDRSMQTAISFGTTLLGALFGRKLASTTNVTRAATSMRSAGRIAGERGDVSRAQESLAAYQQQLSDLEAEFNEEMNRLREAHTPDNLDVKELPIRPRKSDLHVEQTLLAWTPWMIDADGIAERAF